MTAAFIRRLTLANFRSYHAAQISLESPGPVGLTGANGVGTDARQRDLRPSTQQRVREG